MYRMTCALFCRGFYEEDAASMYLLKFPSHPGTYLYSDVDARRAALFVTVLDTIMALYDPCIPEVPGKPLNIKIIRREGSPACYRHLREIHLNTEMRYVSQAAYQFAHELCHMRIPFFVVDDLRWFEESICEMASHYFLKKLSMYFANEANPAPAALKNYAPKFASYSASILEGAKAVDLTSELQMRRFTLDCYLREENLYVAKLLLPVFEEHPELWEALLYLGHIPAGFSLGDSLEIWRNTAGFAEEAISQVKSLLVPESRFGAKNA